MTTSLSEQVRLVVGTASRSVEVPRFVFMINPMRIDGMLHDVVYTEANVDTIPIPVATYLQGAARNLLDLCIVAGVPARVYTYEEGGWRAAMSRWFRNKPSWLRWLFKPLAAYTPELLFSDGRVPRPPADYAGIVPYSQFPPGVPVGVQSALIVYMLDHRSATESGISFGVG